MKNHVKLFRAERGITQEQMAEYIGVSRQTIYAIESGKYIPSTVLALRIAKVLQKPVENIFELEENEGIVSGNKLR